MWRTATPGLRRRTGRSGRRRREGEGRQAGEHRDDDAKRCAPSTAPRKSPKPANSTTTPTMRWIQPTRSRRIRGSTPRSRRRLIEDGDGPATAHQIPTITNIAPAYRVHPTAQPLTPLFMSPLFPSVHVSSSSSLATNVGKGDRCRLQSAFATPAARSHARCARVGSFGVHTTAADMDAAPACCESAEPLRPWPRPLR